MKTLAVALTALLIGGASAQETIILRGPPRPEPRAGWGGPEPTASNVVVAIAEQQCKTPWELISEHPLLSGLARAAKKANDTALMALLNDPQAPITVLAPDNEALASAARALGIPLSAALNGSEPVVSAILRSHVLNTTKPLSQLGPDSTVTAYSGVPVRVFSPTLIAEKKKNGKKSVVDDAVAAAAAPAPAASPLAEKSSKSKNDKSTDKTPATSNPSEPVPRRSRSRRSLSQTTYTNTNLNTPDPSVGGSAIVSSVVDVLNGMLSGGGNSSSNATASKNGGNSTTGSGVSPVDALLNSFISLFAGIMGGGGDGNSTVGGGLFGPMMGGGNGMMSGNGMKGWKVTKRRGCAGGCSRAQDWTFAPLGKTAASSLPDNSTYTVLRNATVEAGNVRTCGGFLHVVDGVIVPEVLSKKDKGKGDSKSVVLELGDGDGAAVSRITVPSDRAMVLVDDSSSDAADAPKQARANITVEYLGKVAKNVAKKNKEESDASKKKTVASPAPAPAAAVAKEEAPSPAPEVSQASVKKEAAKPKQPAAPEPPKAVGETIAPKGAKQPSA